MDLFDDCYFQNGVYRWRHGDRIPEESDLRIMEVDEATIGACNQARDEEMSDFLDQYRRQPQPTLSFEALQKLRFEITVTANHCHSYGEST